MLVLIVAAIMMGFPTAFTMMGLGMIFGFLAFYNPAEPWLANKVFDLFVQRTYGGMNNETLLSIPLFVFMGYIIERAALVDKMFFSVQLAFRRLPASLAVTTLLVCAFWGIASGIVGAVVVLMGVISFRPMLKAGYDVKLASGVITAGGTLGILIPPSVMIIVYAAVAGQSIVKLYAAAMLPGFFLTGLYLVYILAWAIWNPKIAPQLADDQYRVAVPDWLKRLERGKSRSVVPGLIAAAFRPALAKGAASYGLILQDIVALSVPLLLTVGTFGAAWWYVVIYNAPSAQVVSAPPPITAPAAVAAPQMPVAEAAPADQPPEELGAAVEESAAAAPSAAEEKPEELNTQAQERVEGVGQIPAHFFKWFWALAALSALSLLYYFWHMDAEQFEILKELCASVVPLGVLTIVVLAVILFGICTATESAAVGALGALYLAVMARYLKEVLWWSFGGAIVGVLLGWAHADFVELIVSGALGATFAGTLGPGLIHLRTSPELRQNIKEATFLTAKTTAMVCWLFVGSALFSAVFALHGGQSLIERWVLSMNLSPLGFMFIAQVIIFLLGWPLEWTEIIVIFCPIFIPLLGHFKIDPILFGTMVAVNLQAAFLSPPVAMSAFYLKGVAPKWVTLNQIFAGMMPYMLIVCLCLMFMYIWPGMTLWLPEFLYGK
jgi:TRAP-type mannitol/chloroaromatic compound transport system permease large subunit